MTTPTSSSTKPEILIRQANLCDIPKMAHLASTAFANSPAKNFLAPNASKYPEDTERKFRQINHGRYVNPRNLNIVACLPSSPSEPVAYAQFKRLGDDEGAKKFLSSRGWMERSWLWVISWYFFFVDGFQNRIWPDRSISIPNSQSFESWGSHDTKKYWTSFPERENRWHAQSVVVGPKFQGLGIGRKLMGVVLERCEREGVVCGLAASTAGQRLYRKLGFVDLGNFYSRVPNEGPDDRDGGHMLWTPSGKKGL